MNPPRLLRPLLWLPALAWMAFIFYWSSQPALPIDGQPGSDHLHRLAHLIAYAVLALLLALGCGTSPRGLGAALLLATLYGASDELHQSLVPGRQGHPQEVALDGAAAAAALAVFVLLRGLVLHHRADGDDSSRGLPTPSRSRSAS